MPRSHSSHFSSNDRFESPSVNSPLRSSSLQPRFIGSPGHDSTVMAAPVPEISSKYHFQVDLRGHRLPVTITIPIMPDSSESPSEDSLRPSHSIIFPDKNSHVVDSGTATQQPQGAVTDTSNTNTEPLKTNSCVEGLDLLGNASVSTPLCCASTIR